MKLHFGGMATDLLLVVATRSSNRLVAYCQAAFAEYHARGLRAALRLSQAREAELLAELAQAQSELAQCRAAERHRQMESELTATEAKLKSIFEAMEDDYPQRALPG